MDETGPYLPHSKEKDLMTRNDDEIGYREILGPEKPRNLRAKWSSDEESFERREKRAKRDRRSKEKSKDKKKKREKKRSKHHK